jgi:hypothetical protein
MDASSAQYNKGYAVTVLRALDIFVGTLIWRDYGVTISAMTGLELRKPQPAKWAKILGGFLNGISPGHCEGAIASDRLRAKQALAILGDPCAIHAQPQGST